MKKLTQRELDRYLERTDKIRWYDPNFIPADFSNMDLSGLTFNRILRKTNFTNTKLTGTTFNYCVFRDSGLSEKQLLEARFVETNWLKPKTVNNAIWWVGISDDRPDKIDKNWMDSPTDTLLNIDDFMEWYEP